MRGENEGISIWFFIGTLMAFYGLLIAAYGVWSVVNPPFDRPVLYELHADIWWGGLMLAIGILYSVKFSPKRKR